jgi:hypothetical protein
MNELTFSNAAQLLRANLYAPIPLGSDGSPLGPVYVSQTDWARYPAYADAPVAVLTSSPPANGPHAPIQNARDTWLATVTVSVRDELKADVDAIVKRYVGKAKCPVRLADDKALYVFKLAGAAQFSTIATDDPEFARVDSAASFVRLDGEWRGGISLLDVMRSELPELDHERAQQLIGELNACLHAHAPPVAPPAPFVARPLLAPGETLRWKNTRALAALNANGFSNLLPVRFGQQQAEKDGFTDANGRFHHNVDVSEHGVGLSLQGFTLVEFGGRFRADVDELVKSFGPCILRTVAGDDRPVYLFKCDQGGGDETIHTPNVFMHVRRVGVIVLSGVDDKGREYEWSQNLLTVKSSQLHTFERHDCARLQRALESLPSIVEYKAAATKGRKSA